MYVVSCTLVRRHSESTERSWPGQQRGNNGDKRHGMCAWPACCIANCFFCVAPFAENVACCFCVALVPNLLLTPPSLEVRVVGGTISC